MKFAEKIFPKGTFKRQETDGAYINQTLAANLDILAKKINNDMHFLGIITGHDSVGNGKSTLATHVGAYLTNKINELHGTNNTFTEDNIYFKASKMTEGSQKHPRLSVQVLDEGDDLTTHGMKELAVNLKRYFRKCRQLNQIIILILPSFFELPKFYALNRSHFLIDVKFMGEFDRGYFSFYSPNQKKLLYLKGKKEWNYDIVKPSFSGRFFSEYTFFPNLEESTAQYLKRKHEDMLEDEEEHKPLRPIDIKLEILKGFRENLPEITFDKLALGFKTNRSTLLRWLSDDKKKKEGRVTSISHEVASYNNITTKEEENGE